MTTVPESKHPMSSDDLVTEPSTSDGAEEAVVGPTDMSGSVFRGGLWQAGGHIAVLVVSFLATPFVVRLLAPELYGLLSLIQAIIAYLGFSGVGMTLASTRFGTDAHTRGDDEGEVAVVWTSLVLASVPSLVAVVCVSLAAHPLMRLLDIPPHLEGQAVVAIRIAAIGFFLKCVHGSLNTPQAVRLRWDSISKIDSGTSMLQVALVPVILALGGGLVAAITVATAGELVRVLLHIVVSARLQPRLLEPRIRRDLMGPLIRFGGSMLLSSIVMVPLINIERFFLARYESVSAVAYYSVAATVAMLLSVFPMALCQPLLPAFTALHTKRDGPGFQVLFERALRGMFFWTAPAAVLMWVAARPAFTLWAGSDYASESTRPFYILVIGLTVNAFMYPSATALLAVDKARVWVWCHLLQLPPYLVLAAVLTALYGIVGAALAWTIRVVADCVLFSLAARRMTGVRFSPLIADLRKYAEALAVMILPVLAVSVLTPVVVVRCAVALGSVLAYLYLVWTRVLSDDELEWVKSFFRGRLRPAVARSGT